MTDELFNSEQFLFDLPIWFVVAYADSPPDTISLTDSRVGFVCATDDVGEKCCPLFTDEDLANRFVDELNRPGLTVGKIVTPREFLRFLFETEVRGFCYVLFDPRKGTGGAQKQSIEKLRRAMARKKGKR